MNINMDMNIFSDNDVYDVEFIILHIMNNVYMDI